MASCSLSVRLAALLALGLMAAPARSLDGPTALRIRGNGFVTIAHRAAAVPFAYVPGGGAPVGYAIELCARIVAELRRELHLPDLRVRYLPVTATERLSAVESGHADLECGSTTNTPERRRRVAFSVVHFFSYSKAMVRHDAAIPDLPGLLDRSGHRIAVVRGAPEVFRLQQAQRSGSIKAALREVDDVDEALALLLGRQADAFVDNDVSLHTLRASLPEPAAVDILPQPLSVEAEGLVLPHEDRAFKHFVDLVLSRLMVDGDAEPIYHRWFLSPIPPRGINLQLPLSPLMLDQFHFPSDKLGDGSER